MLLYNEDILDMCHQGFREHYVVCNFQDLSPPPTKCNVWRAYDLDPFDAVSELNEFLRDNKYAN